FNEARPVLSQALKLDPKNTDIHLAIAYAKTFRSSDDPHLRAIEAIDLAGFAPAQRIPIHFALGKAYDDLERFDEAFAHFAAGNALRRNTTNGGELDNALIERTMALMGADMIKRRSGHGVMSAR